MNAAFGFRPAFFLLICLFLSQVLSGQEVSCTIQKPPTDPASQAFTSKNYSKALELYTAASKSNPQDMDAIAGQVRSLLKEQQVDAAADLAEKSFATHNKNAVLETVLGEVRFRQGRLYDAIRAYQASLALDPCLPRTRYELYGIMQVESMYDSAYTQLQAAHQLEPDDHDIHIAWIDHLPLAQRSKEIDAYLADPKGRSLDEQKDMKEYADRLHAILAAKNGSCNLTSSSATTATMPFKYLERDESGHYHSLGFDVKVNNKANARLELDTGASGILLDRSTAKKAGLVSIAADTINGIGDEKNMNGYWAYADDFRVGSLEFKNCMVEVSDKRSVVGIDGLIGANVFENYHVQLDFPLHQMTLSPLPPRPGEASNKASLNAAGVSNVAAVSANSKNASGSAAAPSDIHYFDRYVSPEMKSWSPFARFGHQILINAYLKDQKPRLFLLDSGAATSLLSITAAKSVGKIHSDDADRITGLNGRVKTIYTANNVDVLFAQLRDPFKEILVMNLDNLSSDNGTEVSGIIGLDTLIMLTVDIDYRDGLIHLTFDPKHGTNVYGGYTY